MRLLENGEIPTVLQIKRCNDSFRDPKGLKELINFAVCTDVRKHPCSTCKGADDKGLQRTLEQSKDSQRSVARANTTVFLS